MNYATIKKHDVADGPGIRVALFVSGCTHHCKGCFNSETWDFNYGNVYSPEVQEEVLNALSKPYISGLSLLGGEPFEPENQPTVLELVEQVRKQMPDKTIWCYSGYLFEDEIIKGRAHVAGITDRLLHGLDVLVDGEFLHEKKNPSLRFRGSANQRIINVKESLVEQKTILWEDKEEV